jgi:hypothetical protein
MLVLMFKLPGNTWHVQVIAFCNTSLALRVTTVALLHAVYRASLLSVPEGVKHRLNW